MPIHELSENELEKPLLRIDSVIDRFARKVGARIDINRDGCARRYIWCQEPDGMTRALDISPVILHLQKPRTKDNILYSFALHAWKDKERRYGWHAIEAELTDVPVDKKEITTLLERCWAKLKSVSESDLK